jgi:hypothetical protein
MDLKELSPFVIISPNTIGVMGTIPPAQAKRAAQAKGTRRTEKSLF